jgi:glycine/D-amino acid oxidase-like deaminating enzyme
MRSKLFLSLMTLFISCVASAEHPLSEYVRTHLKSGMLEPSAWQELRKTIFYSTNELGQVTPELQEALYQIEEHHYPQFSPDSKSEFQAILGEIGGKFKSLEFAAQMPKNNAPYWISQEDDFKYYRSTASLPSRADIVIIGAGLTGSSAAYHLQQVAKSGKNVVILEAEHPASQSTGKNGGNFQLLPENYMSGTYDGLIQERVKWLKSQSTDLNEVQLKKEAEIQARFLLQFSFRNMARITDIIKREAIACDFSPNGWLKVASSAEEEKSLMEDVKWMRTMETPEIEILSPEQIRAQTHLPAHYAGRLIHGSGNYHPYKFVKGILHKALGSNIKLYTGIQVNQITPVKKGEVLIETQEGKIHASRVIVATNAFTSRLFPELSGIQCVPSQLATFNHVKNALRGYTVTERYGDIYYNFPQSAHQVDSLGEKFGMLLYGLDFPEPGYDPYDIKRSQDILNQQLRQVHERFPSTVGQPASSVWVGPMGFSDDRVPTIGFLSDDIIIAAGFQGYGGSFCIEAGYVAAQMSLTGETHPEVPEAIFSPKRFKLQKALCPVSRK